MTDKNMWKINKSKLNNNDTVYATKDIISISSDIATNSLSANLSGRIKWLAMAYSTLKNFGLGYGLDRKVANESKGQAVLSNTASTIASIGAEKIAGAALAGGALLIPGIGEVEAGVIATRTIVGSAVGSLAGSYIDNHYGKFQSLFNKAKLYVQKNQKADITVPTAKELLNVSNSAAVQQAINQNNAVQVIEIKSQSVGQQDSGAPGWLSSLYNFLNVTNVAVGGTKSVSAYPIIKHTGGKVPGRGDILAILKGGETVRTEAQEKELQEQMLKKHFDSFAPLVSGQGDDEQNQQNGAFSSYAEKKSAKPVLQDRTRHDEEMIIGIIADAWKTNRSGFRRILKSC